MTQALKTVRECLDIQRGNRDPDIEIALQDFLRSILIRASNKNFYWCRLWSYINKLHGHKLTLRN